MNVIETYRLTRFQFARDRMIGDSQVGANQLNAVAVELVTSSGVVGLGFMQVLFVPTPDQAEIERIFAAEVWPGLHGQEASALVHRVSRPRGGNQRSASLPFHESIQVALWDLAAKQAGLPLHRMLGSRRSVVKAYASGLDFHLDDEQFGALFSHAARAGYRAFKIKVGHPDFSRDLGRLRLLASCIPAGSEVMIDANEAWSAKEAMVKLEHIRREGHQLLWVEDPILRDDFDGLRLLRRSASWTQINSGEYLDARGKRLLMQAEATDILNVHGQVTDVMRIGWLAAEMGIPVSLGNTFLEVGVHMAAALPEVEWMEYSFQNYDHLVEEPVRIENGMAHAPDRPGHGLVLSEAARRTASPSVLTASQLGPPPRLARLDAVP